MATLPLIIEPQSAPEAKPEPLAVNFDVIPEELRVRPQWVVWSYKWTGKKWTKPPMTTSGRAASTSNSGGIDAAVTETDTSPLHTTGIFASRKSMVVGMPMAL